MIDFALDDDQQAVQSSMRDYFSRRCPPAVVREVEAGELGYVPELWEEIAELGWLGITIPEEHCGTGGTLLDLYGFYEEAGRSLFPSPHLDTVVVAGATLVANGTDAQREEVLPAITRGECIVGLALVEPDGGFGPGCITMRADHRGGDWVLRGTKTLVGFAPSADWFLCAVRTSGDLGAEGVTVLLVDAASAGVSWTYLPNLGGAALYAVDFDDVVVPPSGVVGEVGAGWAALAGATIRGALLQTASIVGSGRHVLEMTNQYAKDRVQFGKPIGSYQAVQYMVSDILLDVHRADLLARHAAYLVSAGMPHGEEAAVAIAFGKQAAAHIVRQAHEVHGGVAYILDHDLPLYSLRSKYWENNLGDARYHLERLADELSI